MKDPFQSALEKRASAQKEVDAARSRLALAEAELEKWQTFLGTYEELTGGRSSFPEQWAAVNTDDSPLQRESTPIREGASSLTEVIAEEFLRKIERPAKTSEILEFLTNSGFKATGKDPLANLSARLSRSQLFENERKRWVLKKPADGEGIDPLTPSAANPTSGPVEPAAGGGT